MLNVVKSDRVASDRGFQTRPGVIDDPTLSSDAPPHLYEDIRTPGHILTSLITGSGRGSMLRPSVVGPSETPSGLRPVLTLFLSSSCTLQIVQMYLSSSYHGDTTHHHPFFDVIPVESTQRLLSARWCAWLWTGEIESDQMEPAPNPRINRLFVFPSVRHVPIPKILLSVTSAP